MPNHDQQEQQNDKVYYLGGSRQFLSARSATIGQIINFVAQGGVAFTFPPGSKAAELHARHAVTVPGIGGSF